jgi:transcriptional regulator with XRE-family HTH domain
MQPDQLRAARGALNWNLDRLAEESGVHRNTLSNFETRKYQGDPAKLDTVRRTLEAAGIIFEDGEDAGVLVRRFQPGDVVRLRRETRVHLNYDVAPGQRGIVTGVEPHPPQTGPTYRIWVRFLRAAVAGVFRYEYELVHTAFTADETGLLEQLAEHDQTISGNKSRSGLARVIRFGYVTEAPLNISDTIYSLTDSGRAVLALWKSTNARPGAA